MQTGLRGFLIAGTPVFQRPYNAGSAAIGTSLSDLERMVSDNPPQVRRTQSIRESVARWREFAEREIALRRSGGDYVSVMKSLYGVRLMESMRARFEEFQSTERALRKARDAKAQRATRYTVILCVVASLLAGVAMALSAAGLLRRLSLSYKGAIEDATEGRERLAVMLRSIGDAVIATDLESRVKLMNTVAEKLTGWTEPDAVGKPLSDVFNIVNEQTRARAEDPVQRVLREGAIVALANHTTLIARDGAEYMIEDSAAPIMDANKMVSGVILVFRDATRKREEQARFEDLHRQLEERAREQQAILENIPVGLAIANDPECRTMTGNPRLYEMLQMPTSSNVSKTAEPDEYPTAYVTVNKQGKELPGEELPLQIAVSTGKPVRASELRFRRGDGSEIVTLVSAVPLFDESGAVRGGIGCVEDITERTALEDALRERQERLEIAQEAAGFATWDWNILTDETTWHGPTAPSFMLPDQALPGSSSEMGRLVHPDDRAIRQAAVERARHGDGRFSAEYRICLPDGSIRWVNSRGSVVKWRDGKPAHISGLMLDITERKLAEASAIEAQRLESVGKLAGGIAHEFNNMLTVIVGYAEVIGNSLPPGSPLSEGINHISRSANRAADLTSQLLSFARKQMVRYESVDLNELIASVGSVLNHLLGETVELSMLPAPNMRLTRADRGQMEQLLVNLALNARDAMPDGGKFIVETQITTLDAQSTPLHREVVAGEYVLLSVTDTGCGMDRVTLERAFEPFFTTKEVGKGTGLGLSTCFGIVRQAGGYIWAYSDPGHGTTVKIYLPILDESGTNAAMAAARAAEMPRGAETILIAEDDEVVCALAANSLRELGYRILDAPDGEAALLAAAAHDGNIDLLLTDVVMPKMGGRELADRLIVSRPGIKTMFMSGYASGAIQSIGEIIGDAPFVQKPFTPSNLAQRIRQALDTAAAGKPAR
jgi:PAS domain S-box-containing protein